MTVWPIGTGPQRGYGDANTDEEDRRYEAYDRLQTWLRLHPAAPACQREAVNRRACELWRRICRGI